MEQTYTFIERTHQPMELDKSIAEQGSMTSIYPVGPRTPVVRYMQRPNVYFVCQTTYTPDISYKIFRVTVIHTEFTVTRSPVCGALM